MTAASTYENRLADISYYWGVKLDNEASLLALKIGCRRLVPAVGNALGKAGVKRIRATKSATTIKTRHGIVVLSTWGNFSEIKIVAGYILVSFASIQLQILLISIGSTDEQFAGWVV